MHIIVTGNVAVGKSHISKVLLHNLSNAIFYPEFIYKDAFAMELLDRRFKSEISALTFQNFILDKWEYYSKINAGKDGIKIYERLPDDAVEIFSKLSLSESEYKIQKSRLETINKTIPSYKNMTEENCLWIRYENNFTKSLQPLIDVVEKADKEYVVIEVRSRTAFENYVHRNRKEEFYTAEEIMNLQEIYNSYLEEQIKHINCKFMEL